MGLKKGNKPRPTNDGNQHIYQDMKELANTGGQAMFRTHIQQDNLTWKSGPNVSHMR